MLALLTLVLSFGLNTPAFSCDSPSQCMEGIKNTEQKFAYAIEQRNLITMGLFSVDTGDHAKSFFTMIKDLMAQDPSEENQRQISEKAHEFICERQLGELKALQAFLDTAAVKNDKYKKVQQLLKTPSYTSALRPFSAYCANSGNGLDTIAQYSMKSSKAEMKRIAQLMDILTN